MCFNIIAMWYREVDNVRQFPASVKRMAASPCSATWYLMGSYNDRAESIINDAHYELLYVRWNNNNNNNLCLCTLYMLLKCLQSSKSPHINYCLLNPFLFFTLKVARHWPPSRSGASIRLPHRYDDEHRTGRWTLIITDP